MIIETFSFPMIIALLLNSRPLIAKVCLNCHGNNHCYPPHTAEINN